MKKIFLLLMTLLFMTMGVNATTVINSCGGVGWVNGETYLLNFSSITSPTCLQFGKANYNNIKIIGTMPINVQIDNSVFFFADGGELNSVNYLKNNITFENINLYSSNDYKLNSFLYLEAHLRDHMEDWLNGNFNNITIEMKSQSLLRFSYRKAAPNYVTNGRFNYNSFTNLNLKNSDYLYWSSVGGTGGGYYQITGNNFYNSYINTNIKLNYLSTSQYVRTQNNNFYDSLIISPTLDYAGNSGSTSYYSGNKYYSGMNQGEFHTDVNNDGVADSDLLTNVFGARITLNLFDKEFLQDFDEGSPFIDSGDNIVFVNNLQIGSPDIVLIDEFTNIDTSLIFTLFDNINGFQMGDYSSLCSDPIDGRCFYQDHSTPFNYALEYKGLVRVGDYTTVENIDFNKIYSTNNAHLISNPSSTLLTNINIQNNNFLKADDQFKFLDNYLIKLNANNVQIRNNTFNLSSTFNNGYEVIQILGNDKWSNDITLNEFNLNIPLATTPTYIFTNNSRTKFYNNYLDSNIEVHSDFNINIVQNPVISYETGGVIYYWTIGNYYVDNTGCIDLDTNGICDSSYTIGNYTDYFPLSSYPFVPEDRLLTADSTATISNYTVSLHNITEGETVNLVDGTETLQFGFSHDSDYPDLQCGYYLDAINFGGISNPVKNSIYSFQKTNGWTTKTYALRVDCTNAQGTESTGDLNFNVILSSETFVCGNAILEGAEQCDDGNTLNGDGCSSVCQFEGNVSAICGNGVWELPEQCDDGNLLNGDGCSSICKTEVTEPVNNMTGVDTDFNIFGENIEESGDNLNEIMNLASAPLGWGLILGSVFMGITGVILIFSIAGLLLR